MMIRIFQTLKIDFQVLFFFCLGVSKGVEKLLPSMECELWLYAELCVHVCVRAYTHTCALACIHMCVAASTHPCALL